MPFAAVSGRTLYYEFHGPAPQSCDALPLVLLHGTAGTCRGWLPLQVPDFSKSRPVLLVDYRGAGQSEDDGSDFGTADLAEDVAGLLDELTIPRADVLGAFLGGMVAQELALQHPARLRRIVLTGTYARADAKRRMLLDHWADLTRAGAPYAAVAISRLLWSLQDETFEQSDLIDSFVEFVTRHDPPAPAEVMARQCRACRDHDTADRLRDIPHPTLVICGRNDRLTPPAFHRLLADEIPDARLVTTHYGGHLVLAEAAERFNHSVLQFLEEPD